jgi:predicted acyl esterase
MIPVRDGVRLSIKIFTPRDQAGRLPIILKRTPYGIASSAGNFDAYTHVLNRGPLGVRSPVDRL